MPPHTPSALSRRGFLAYGAAAGALGLTGCSASAAASTAPPTTLNVWGGVPPENGPAALCAAFEAAYPGHRVTYTRYVNDERGNVRLDSALQGGVDIDVYFTYGTQQLALRAGSGMADDLTEDVAADPQLSAFLDRDAPKGLWQDDRLTALATAAEPYLVLANEQHLERAGVAVPDTWSVEEFVETTRELTRDGTRGAFLLPDVPRIALGPDYWYTASGGSNFSDPHFRDHMRLSRELVDDDVLFPWDRVLSGRLKQYQQNPFVAGAFSLWYTAPFNLRYLRDAEQYPHDFRVVAAPVPTTSTGSWNTGQYNNFIMISPATRKRDLAWEFVRFWVTDGAAAMAPGGKIPTLGGVGEDEMLAALLGEDADRWFDVDSFRRVLYGPRPPELFVDTRLTAYPEITLAVSQQQDLCWLGEKDPDAAVASIDSQASAAIARDARSAA